MNYPIAFLCWIDRCLFPEDVRKELLAAGVEESDAIEISSAFIRAHRAGKAPSIIQLYQCFASSNGTCETLDTYLASMYGMWTRLQSESRTVGDSAWIAGTPPEDAGSAWLLLECFHPDGNIKSVILAVRDDIDWWSEAGDWKAESFYDPVTDKIIGWQPHVIPAVPRG